MEKHARIYVAGGETLIGSALLRELPRQGYTHILGGSADEPNLSDPREVEAFFLRSAPEYVFVAAGKSGGIAANQKYPADLMLDNLLLECNLIPAAHRFGVRKLLYLASSCSYPKFSPQPMREEHLLAGPLEPTNEAYAVAKIAGIKLCQAYRQQHGANFVVGIPANAFGPGDDFSPENSHVVAAMMRRMHEAKLSGAHAVDIWGTGSPRREFIYADNLAEACLVAMREYDDPEPINLGGGADLSIKELARLIQEVTDFGGQIHFDATKPDGMPVKILDSSKLLALGWQPRVAFPEALRATYDWFLQSLGQGETATNQPHTTAGGHR
ncbi:MAG: GDP-L-fucose synthase family protein [Chloroflexota bacterium]